MKIIFRNLYVSHIRALPVVVVARAFLWSIKMMLFRLRNTEFDWLLQAEKKYWVLIIWKMQNILPASLRHGDWCISLVNSLILFIMTLCTVVYLTITFITWYDLAHVFYTINSTAKFCENTAGEEGCIAVWPVVYPYVTAIFQRLKYSQLVS
jgi:hypothetical protein